jgi:hypothetical protein
LCSEWMKIEFKNITWRVMSVKHVFLYVGEQKTPSFSTRVPFAEAKVRVQHFLITNAFQLSGNQSVLIALHDVATAAQPIAKRQSKQNASAFV